MRTICIYFTYLSRTSDIENKCHMFLWQTVLTNFVRLKLIILYEEDLKGNLLDFFIKKFKKSSNGSLRVE